LAAAKVAFLPLVAFEGKRSKVFIAIALRSLEVVSHQTLLILQDNWVLHMA